MSLVQDGILRAVSDSPMVVKPGFFGTDRSGTIRSFGRGGSDLTAVLLAIILPPWESLCETAGRWCWRD
jgi:aspartokinase